MIKVYTMLLLFISAFLYWCGIDKNLKNKNIINNPTNLSNNKLEFKKTRGSSGDDNKNDFKKQVYLYYKNNDKLINRYKKYNININILSNNLWISKEDAKLLWKKYYPYLKRYRSIKNKFKNTSANNELVSQYENILMINFKNDNINFKNKDIDDLLSGKIFNSLKEIYKSNTYIEKYTLPNWELVTPDIKKKFNIFIWDPRKLSKENEIYAIQDFKKNILIEQFMEKWECNKIEDSIKKAECKYYNNIK